MENVHVAEGLDCVLHVMEQRNVRHVMVLLDKLTRAHHVFAGLVMEEGFAKGAVGIDNSLVPHAPPQALASGIRLFDALHATAVVALSGGSLGVIIHAIDVVDQGRFRVLVTLVENVTAQDVYRAVRAELPVIAHRVEEWAEIPIAEFAQVTARSKSSVVDVGALLHVTFAAVPRIVALAEGQRSATIVIRPA